MSEAGELEDRDPATNGARATSALGGTRFGPVEWVAETGSTNDDLVAAAAGGAGAGLVRVADHQLAGRGRRDRSWEAATGEALLVSVLLRPELDPAALGVLTAAFGVAGAEACAELGCPGAQIKWPNDLVAGPPGEQRKLAGILAQSLVVGGELAVVVGLGVNVRSAGLAELVPGAGALDQLGPPPPRLALLVTLLRRVDELLEELPDTGGLWHRYRALSATLATDVRIDLDAGPVTGRAVDVTDAGALVVRTAAGTREVFAGDVVSLR